MICQFLADQLKIDQLATDKLQYFVQPRPVILLLYIELFNSFLIGRKHAVNFQNQHP